MRTMKCPNCSGNFIYQHEGYYVCEYCGAISEGVGESDLKEEDVIDLDNANYRRDQYEFDEALSLCQKVLQRNPLNAEANRCAILAKYRIVYLKRKDGEYVATFLDPNTEPITQSPYYRNLPEILKREMDKVEVMRLKTIRNSKNIPQYDIFISYKSGTEEAEWAKECYKMLLKQRSGKRYNIFYEEASLGKKQAGWEPHIYSALKSARCLILFASLLANINSDWVTNGSGSRISKKKMRKRKLSLWGNKFSPTICPIPLCWKNKCLWWRTIHG